MQRARARAKEAEREREIKSEQQNVKHRFFNAYAFEVMTLFGVKFFPRLHFSLLTFQFQVAAIHTAVKAGRLPVCIGCYAAEVSIGLFLGSLRITRNFWSRRILKWFGRSNIPDRFFRYAPKRPVPASYPILRWSDWDLQLCMHPFVDSTFLSLFSIMTRNVRLYTTLSVH